LPRFSEREFTCVLYALMELRALIAEGHSPKPRRQERAAATDYLDAEALRRAVLLRRALVDEGDYFAFLGVPRQATGYAIRSAYLELRRQFAPERAVAATSDLVDDLALIGEVLDEAYEVLGDSTKRERYLRAIESVPQAVGPMARQLSAREPQL
jgi:DnaJ domain